MRQGRDADEGQQGSILLPVILLLLVIATAATAMTLQARTSLREAATRRDRLVLAAVADGAVRAAALALASAAASQASPPFGLDGTPQGCRIGARQRLILTIQDEGGLVDLNKGNSTLIEQVLRRVGVSAPDAENLAKAIAAHRADAPQPRSKPVSKPSHTQPTDEASPVPQDFVMADEIGDLPGMDTSLFARLRPLFTTANRSAGFDAAVAAPAIRALIPSKELAAAPFEALLTPSNHSDFTITAWVSTPSGQSFARRASFRLDPDAGPLGRFTGWDASPLGDPPADTAPGGFCQRLAAALAAP